MFIAITELERTIRKYLSAHLTSLDEDSIARIADVVLYAEIAGVKSHGLVRLMPGSFGPIDSKPTATVAIERPTKVSRSIHAHGAPGMLVTSLATDEALACAKESGIGLVGTQGSLSSSGCLSYYVDKISSAGFVGIVMSQTKAVVVPFGTNKKLFGTNPLAIGVPGRDESYFFDFSTAAVSYGEVKRVAELGEKLSPNLAVDPRGLPTTDPVLALQGGLLPFSLSHKASGLAMAIELLAGPLCGASFSGVDEELLGWGNLVIAIAPSALGPSAHFKERVEEFFSVLRQQVDSNGQNIRLPGERSKASVKKCRAEGKVEVSEPLYQKILTRTSV